jgi:hypothetical protein
VNPFLIEEHLVKGGMAPDQALDISQRIHQSIMAAANMGRNP